MNILFARKSVILSLKNTFFLHPVKAVIMFYITIYTHQKSDHAKTILPPHLEINFLIDSGGKFNVINNDIWIECTQN